MSKNELLHICKYCGESSKMIVMTDSYCYHIIKCDNCGQVVTEGFGDPEELLDDIVEYDNYE